MTLIADIFVTSKDRPDLLGKTLSCIKECTQPGSYRLTVVQDGLNVDCDNKVFEHDSIVEHRLEHKECLGLGPSINQALSHIDTLDRWYEHPTHGDRGKVAPFICYIQDDVLVTPGWLQKMLTFFMMYEKQHNLGFASGIECVEHATSKTLPNGMLLKPWIRAANMFGRREYWMSMFPIPRLDVETGQVRARPNDGMGSGVDWWFVRNHENSVTRTGRTNLVIPGLMVHAGYDRSTWLKRELPESDSDKKKIESLR